MSEAKGKDQINEAAQDQEGKRGLGGGQAKPLTQREALFVRHYLIHKNGTKAAIEAGYSENGAAVTASRLLRRANVAAEIERLTEKTHKKLEITEERILNEIARVAFFDPRKLFNPDGSPIPIEQLDDDTAAAIAGLEVHEEYIGQGDDRIFVGYTKKYRLANKLGALELLGKNRKMFTDKVEHSGKVESVVVNINKSWNPQGRQS